MVSMKELLEEILKDPKYTKSLTDEEFLIMLYENEYELEDKENATENN